MPSWSDAAQWQMFDSTGRRKYLTGNQRQSFLLAADRAAPEARALAYVLAYTGCRVSEAITLQRHQLDAHSLELVLRTLKRRRMVYRSVPVPPVVAELLLALPCSASAPERFWTWHRATAWRRMKMIMAAAGVAGPAACPKGLRHGFGHRAAEKNVLPSLTQKWMGHSDARTTAIYQTAVGIEERAFAARMW